MSFPDNHHHRLVEYAATSSSSSATPPSPPSVLLDESVHGAPAVKIKIKYRGDNFANMSSSEESATTESSSYKTATYSPSKTAAGNMDKAAPESMIQGGVDPKSSSQSGLPGGGGQQQPRESSRFSDVDVIAARASHKVPDTGLLGVLDSASSNDDPKEPTPVPENRRDKRRSGDSVTPKKVQIEEADKNAAEEEEEARETTPAPPAGDGLTEEVFVVESILQHKNKGKKRLFLVRWEGYGSDEDSWEPEDNLSSAKLALEEYFKKNPSAEGGSGKKKKGCPPKAVSTAAAASGSKRRGRPSKEETATPSKRSRRGEPEEEVAEEPVEEPEDQYAQEKEDDDYDEGEAGTGRGRGGAGGKNKKPKTKAELKAFPKTTPTSTASKASVRRVYLETRQNWLADSSDDDDSDKEEKEDDESTPVRPGVGLEKKAAAANNNKEKERQTRASSSSAGRDSTAAEKDKAVKPKREWLHRGAVAEGRNEEQEEDKRGSEERAAKERSSKKKDKHHRGRRDAKEDMRFSPPPPSNLTIVPSLGSSLRSTTHSTSINGGLAVVGSGGTANSRAVVEGIFKRASSGELLTVIRDSPHSASRVITVDEARATACSALVDFLLPRMQFSDL